MLFSVIYLTALPALVIGFEYRDPKQFKAAALQPPNRALTADQGDSEYCLIFEDQFNTFNLKTWQHEITLAGGGNWEFQHYTNNRSNSFVEDGILYLKPTLTSDSIGEQAVKSGGKISLYSGQPASDCTDNSDFGCERISGAAANGNYLNPIQSARIRSINSVSFRYGKVEVRARLPRGDWLWPAIWMLPKYNAYGSWPASGEIDILEGFGNENFPYGNSSVVSSTLHWGPFFELNRFNLTHNDLHSVRGETWADSFHTYGMEWSEEGIRTYVDSNTILEVDFDQTSWEKGKFDKNVMNPWKGGDIAAPFDQEFYLILNLAVGGVNGYWNDHPSKPWKNNETLAMNHFYDAKQAWLPTWGEGNRRALGIDWIKIWSKDTEAKCLND
ncbi:Beta-1,3-glucan-binding protein [Choanephora cucurbitarum]|uniref:Beta-1,3-glucan-binding protein n=1 Tax=Choanephora cucurbitarum TaxID=101091 RepID=A0A1C7N032_9FUNG|nr:Beta-1,3-glucan-binding protein [Choanephora cucurbitarum]